MEILIGMVLWGYVCHKMATNRGREPLLGALFGALFGIFAVIGYWIAGNKDK
jgi:hypothetical protein